MHTVFSGAVVHSTDFETLEILTDAVLVVKDGKIVSLSTQKLDEVLAKLQGEHHGETPEVVELKPSQFLFPGFFDTHIHAAQYPNVGIFGTTTLLDWLDRYTFPVESQFEQVDKAKQVYQLVVDRTLANGTTMASYYGTIHIPATLELAKLCAAKGQRALVGRVCMERHCPEALVDKDPLAKDKEFVKAVRGLGSELVDAILTPRFAASCTAETLAAQGKLAAEENVQVQTHLNENDKEIEWMRELFPGAEHYTDIYDKAGLLRKGSVYAHCVHMTDRELDLMKEREAGISHCPLSNSSLGSGIAPVLHMLKAGQKVSLGTDVSGGYSPSVLVNARQAILMSRELARASKDDSHKLVPEHVLYLATLGGASVLDRESELGNFEVGKQFDAQLIDLNGPDSQIDVFDWAVPSDPKERLLNLVTKWLYVGDDRNTRSVWVNGKQVVSK